MDIIILIEVVIGTLTFGYIIHDTSVIWQTSLRVVLIRHEVVSGHKIWFVYYLKNYYVVFEIVVNSLFLFFINLNVFDLWNLPFNSLSYRYIFELSNKWENLAAIDCSTLYREEITTHIKLQLRCAPGKKQSLWGLCTPKAFSISEI
jgi:hypothetical protein